MKNLLCILLLAISFNCYAQDPQLFDDTWYLQKLTLDGEDILPPNISNPVTESTFDEDGPIFTTGYCYHYVADITFNDSNSSFNIDSLTDFGITSCDNAPDFQFHPIYIGYFQDGAITFNPFVYEITNTNGVRFLEFTNANGDNALYANQLLAVQDQQVLQATLHPNPTQNTLNITLNTNAPSTITIYDITGKKMLTQTSVATKNSIDVSPLRKGVYFAHIQAVNGIQETHSFIKQ